MTYTNFSHVPGASQQFSSSEAKPVPDKLKISIQVDGELVEVGRRYRGKDGKLQVAWTVPAREVMHQIFYLHF